MANEFVQTMSDARVDARSLSEFVFKPAGFKVSRRLAPPIDTLQFYIDRFDATKATADAYVATIPNIVNDAINNTAVEGGVLADTFVTVTANGSGSIARTQRDKNSDTVSVKDFANAVDAQAHALSAGVKIHVPAGTHVAADPSSLDMSLFYGEGAIKSSDSPVLYRPANTYYAHDYNDLTFSLLGSAKTLKVEDEVIDLVARKSPEIGFGDGFIGNAYSSEIKGTLKVVSGDTHVERLKIQPNLITDYGIRVQYPANDNVPQPFLTDISDVIIREGNGVLINSVETVLNNVRVEGNGIQNNPADADKPRTDYAFRCTSNVRGDTSSSFDISYSSLFSRGTKIGFSAGGATIGFDGHFVGCDVALSLRGDDSTGTNTGQNTFFGIYGDHSWQCDIDVHGRHGVGIYSPFMLQTGYHNTDPTQEVYGISMRGNSRHNLIMMPTFNTVDLTKVTSLLNFEPTAYNNIVIGANGSYKVSDANKKELRKQTVLGCSGQWAQHNNVPRLNRAAPQTLLAGESKVFQFTLDFTIPKNQASVTLLKGSFAARTTSGSGDSAIGDVYVVLGDSNNNLKSTFKIVSTTLETLTLSIVSAATLSTNGYILDVVVKNDSAVPLVLAMELQRSVDTLGLCY